MLFVVGARRSGTLWLQRMIAAHPAVASIPSETYLFSYGISQVFERIQHGMISSPRVASVYADREQVVAAARGLCDAIFVSSIGPEDRLLVERTPWHAQHLGLIAEIYPDARVLHIVRDGRDVTRSLRHAALGPGDRRRSSRGMAQHRHRGETGAARRGAARGPLRGPADGARGADPLDLRMARPADRRRRARPGPERAGRQGEPRRRRERPGGKWRREWGAAELADFERVGGPLLDELGYEALDVEGPAAEPAVRAAQVTDPAPRPNRCAPI